MAAIATRNGSQELAKNTLPYTMAFAAKYIEPIKKTNAPTKSEACRDIDEG